MFCVKCGKKIDYDSRFCKECEAEASAEKTDVIIYEKKPEPQPEPKPVVVNQAKESDKSGFNLALTAIIMAPIVWIMGLAYFSSVQYNIEELLLIFKSEVVFDLVVNSIHVLACIAASIVVLVLSAKAQKKQEEVVQNGGVSHNATIVLAIIARVFAIIALVCYGNILIDTIRLFF